MAVKTTGRNVAAVDGFTALGKSIGIKKGKRDFAVIHSSKICNAAAVYTRNKVKGAPIYVTKKHLEKGTAQAIAVISGVANVATGRRGIRDAFEICELVAEELWLRPEDVLVASTGVIGKYIPMDLVRKGVVGIGKKLKRDHHAAEAIMTTDTVKKEIVVKSGNFTIGAIAKGSGMICPNMATMLCFITTDASLSSAELKACLVNSVNESFNMLSVDRDTSTSDMVVVMSNCTRKADKKDFQETLTIVCKEMAKKIAADGEGATKLVEVTVKNAKTKNDARSIAKEIVSSNLMKCALFGNDPNWGRILSAIGNSHAYFREKKLDVFLQNKQIVKNGVEASDFDGKLISRLMKNDKVNIIIDLKIGKEEATAYGCDMSYDYVTINADYHT
ncbi:MAG: bifunctional glutamate N-acetyltransferase/amino-acid acetyltransferase ArgJ [Candidatus Thermoplasmatota archaeon]|nr:bifunctional glutamate N-acetyltransferase/amino-acid acetyltransferase ArgJ [Candidatus Thermoplasmatota archaeon]